MSQLTQIEAEPQSVERPPARPRRSSLRGFQAKVGSVLLVVFLGPFIFIGLWARNDAIGRWESGRLLARTNRSGELYLNVDNYFDAGDKMLLRDLPKADFSHGGAYVFGSSSSMYSLADYWLPPEQSKYIHNYGVYAMNHHEMLQFMHWLVDYWGLLKAGGDNTMAIIGLTYTNAVAPPRNAFYFPWYFERSGVFSYSYDTGISLVPMNPIERFLRIEDARTRSVVHRWLEDPSLTPRRDYDPVAFRNDNIKRLGTEWESVMAREIPDLANVLDYLKANHVRVFIFRIPEGSWNQGIPARERYLKESDRVLKERGLTALDLTHFVDDSEYYDAIHFKTPGTLKVGAKLLPYAQDFLRDKGLLPQAVHSEG